MSNINDLKKFLLGLYLNSITNINLDELESSGYTISEKNISKLIDEGILIFGGNNTFYITINELQKKTLLNQWIIKNYFLILNYLIAIFKIYLS